MELPIARQSYTPSTDALVRAAQRAGVILARAAAADEHDLDGAIAFTHRRRPGVRSANCLAEVAADATLWPRAVAHFQQAGATCLEVHAIERDLPAGWRETLESQGYRRRTRRLFRFDPRRQPPPRPHTLQLVPARAVFAPLRQYYLQRFGLDEVADAMIDRLDESRLELFAARIEGQVAGVCGVLTLGQIGVIDNAFVLDSFRGRSVGPALLAHTLDHCRRAQFEQVIVHTPEGCPAIRLYESMGFHPLATFDKYARITE